MSETFIPVDLNTHVQMIGVSDVPSLHELQ